MFQRLIAIPQEEYFNMTALQNVRQPLQQQFTKLDSQYRAEENILDPYKRLAHQSETLERMKRLKEQMRQQLTITTPKPYRNRAQSLFNSIESFLKFNERGELLDENDRIIPNSRVEDLVQHAVRDRRRQMLPEGWPHFLNVLRDHNVPKSTLNRDTLNEMDSHTQSQSVIKNESSSMIKKEPSSMIKQKSAKRLAPSKIPRAVQRFLPKRSARPDFLKDFK